MSIETCANCNKKFELIINQMSYPVNKEVESYYCPYCHHEGKRSVRGTFKTESLPESER